MKTIWSSSDILSRRPPVLRGAFWFWPDISIKNVWCPNIQWTLSWTWLDLICSEWTKCRAWNYWVSGRPRNGDRNPNLGSRFSDWKPWYCQVDRHVKIRVFNWKPRNCWGNQNSDAGFLNGKPNFNHDFYPCQIWLNFFAIHLKNMSNMSGGFYVVWIASKWVLNASKHLDLEWLPELWKKPSI